MFQLSDIVDKKKQSLQSCVNELQRNVLPKLIRRKEQIESGKKRYEQKLNGMTKDIEDEKACLFRAFDRIYTAKLTCLKETTDSDLLVFDGFEKDIQRRIKLCEKRISEYQVVIEKKSRTDVIKYSLPRDELLTMGCDSELPEPPTVVPGLTIENASESSNAFYTVDMILMSPDGH
ncbi:hypothetical protein FSP39_000553 [Pinctada imbricata]|uniref:Uncharacterized protein n=1 Tax=Pinctada imbricata TaxID=66713 RepID=A0AA88XCA8_PINIB|nr:hypothetical protein FSP39_000553 [Pinctada imbricata]